MSQQFTFHALGLPHTITSPEYVACAYTQKLLKFCAMMVERGHIVYHYGHEDSVVNCTEHVSVLTNADWSVAYGDHDWRKNFFKYDTGDHAYQTFYKNAIEEIQKRKQPNDFILPFWGCGVKPICDAHSDLITVEPGIGYAGGHFAKYKIFESYAIMHAYNGLDNVGTCNQNFYDVVIPNYFDPDNFTYSADKEDYFLFLGRVYAGKGIHVAIQVTEAIGAKLVIAGQNSLAESGYTEIPSHVEVIGYADIETRKKLMAGAKGAFVASLYLEPFGGVMVECMFSGTPVISTDWGSMAENNLHGVTGYRCRTFEHFLWAAKNIENINPQNCRDWAVNNFSMDVVAGMYEEYFKSVLDIHTGNGWYERNDERNNLDYLEKVFPNHKPRIDYTVIENEERPFADRLAIWIESNINPVDVIDLGCGPGIHVYALSELGIDAIGIDCDARVDAKHLLIQDDLLNLKTKYEKELVLCFEVAEHIDPQYSADVAKVAYDSIKPGGTLIWTAARPGQGGVGHINCRPKAYWKNMFEGMGLIHNDALLENCVSYCREGYHMGWFANNAMIFNKPSE